MSKIIKVASRITPLCYLPSGKLVCYKCGDLIIIENKVVVRTVSLFNTVKERFLSRNKLLYRLMRLGVRAAIALDENNILLSVGNIIYEYNLNKSLLSEGFVLPKGVRPLIFENVRGIYGFTDGVIFGGYLNNPLKEAVGIYRRKSVDSWEIVYTFEPGTINHVHNIVSDVRRACLWIFTGDFGKAAAIWKVSDDFKKINSVLENNQDYRGCIAFPVENGLLYATDAPFMENSIKLLSISSEEYEEKYNLKTICTIDGSCIYGCKVGENFVFSTVVEPDGRKESLVRLLFNYKIGQGIKNRYSHLYAGNIHNGFNEILNLKKDFLPFLFQFGTMRFPNGENTSNNFYFQPIATKNDLSLYYCELDK